MATGTHTHTRQRTHIHTRCGVLHTQARAAHHSTAVAQIQHKETLYDKG